MQTNILLRTILNYEKKDLNSNAQKKHIHSNQHDYVHLCDCLRCFYLIANKVKSLVSFPYINSHNHPNPTHLYPYRHGKTRRYIPFLSSPFLQCLLHWHGILCRRRCCPSLKLHRFHQSIMQNHPVPCPLCPKPCSLRKCNKAK